MSFRKVEAPFNDLIYLEEKIGKTAKLKLFSCYHS